MTCGRWLSWARLATRVDANGGGGYKPAERRMTLRQGAGLRQVGWVKVEVQERSRGSGMQGGATSGRQV